MATTDIFVYDWRSEEITEPNNWHTELRFYGLDSNNVNTCVRIKEFRVRLVIEFIDKNYLINNFQIIRNKFCSLIYNRYDWSSIKIVYKRRLYGANIDADGNHKLFPFVEILFSSKIGMLSFKKRIPTLSFDSEIKFHEIVNPEIQFMIDNNLPASGWVKIVNAVSAVDSEKITRCQNEYLVIKNQVVQSDKISAVDVKILSWDIEAKCKDISKNPGKDLDDCVFQISCVSKRLLSGGEKKYLLTLGKCNRFDNETEIRYFENERDIILGFSQLLIQEQPNVITGWNIFNFDFKFMINRAEQNMCLGEFTSYGMILNKDGDICNIKWSSKANLTTNISYVSTEGILPIDLIDVVRKDYKLASYSLNNVATHFLESSKDDVSFEDLMSAYKDFLENNSQHPETFSKVGKYCVQDSKLVLDLFDLLKSWLSLTEMSKTTSTPIINVHTNGQQRKFYNQMLRFCRSKNILVESNAYKSKSSDNYAGAYVFDPEPGIYNYVTSFDFASLYPSIIEAYNLDYTTLVANDSEIDESKLYVFEWEDHLGCDHDPNIIKMKSLTAMIECCDRKQKSKLVKERASLSTKIPKRIMCQKNKYRFLKEDIFGKGVLPTIIENLLEARRQVRAEMKKISDPVQLAIMNQRQLSYKISANSMYGATGVKSGALPFMPIAMCTTYVGRESVKKAANIIQDLGGSIVYGDTDSNYVTFDNIKGDHYEKCSKIWELAKNVAKEVSSHYKHPMKIEFEDCIYSKFLILTKKRYMYFSCDKDGNESENIGQKGVLLARRDNCKFTRDMYRSVVLDIFDGLEKEKVIGNFMDRILKLYRMEIPVSDLTITKSVNDYNGCNVIYDEEIHKYKMGAYTVREAPEDCENKTKFWISNLPAQVQLDIKIANRGEQKTEGARLEYIVTKVNGAVKQCDKIEEYKYYLKHVNNYTIDRDYYMKQIVKPVEQLFEKVFNIRNSKYVFESVNKIKQKEECCETIKKLFRPRFILDTKYR